MNSSELTDFDFLDDDLFVEHEAKVKSKNRKRKWREIESIKEQRRLKKELAEYESYSF